MKSIRSIITILVGVLLLAGLIYIHDPEKLVHYLKESDPFYLVASTIFLIIMHIVMAFRAKYVGKLLNEKIRLMDAFKAHMLGMFISEFTPGRSGYFISSAYLRKKGVDSGKALTILVSAQPFDFASKFLGASIGFLLLLNLNPAFLLIPLAFSILFFLVVFCPRFTKIIEKIAEKTIYKITYIKELAKKLMSYLKEMNKHSKVVVKKWYVIMGYIFLSYSSRIANWFLLLYGVNAYLSNSAVHDFLMFYLLQPLINIIEFIPLPTPAGSGFSETAAILVLGKFGVPATKALAFALLARIQTVLVSFVFGYLPAKETASYIKKRLL